MINMKKIAIICCMVWLLLPMAARPGDAQVAEGMGSVIILRVQYAASTLNEEFVVIFNQGKTAVDISGWVLFNSYYQEYRNLPLRERNDVLAWKHVYRIPYGVVLEPRRWVRICSGHGQDNELYLYRNLNGEWLEDEGDTVYLMDTGFTVIDQKSWP
ncbi:MAG: hypothetical protein AYK18_12285 [Theionarchaea archaeon DG-70]|nr:MAG: hypothetical protein AYK18_12285 [Theionarchaea archaeon DG-70]